MAKRFATCLAVVAALAFVADGALGADHHLPAAGGSGHYHTHAHVHSHGPADASGHQLVNGDVDLAATHGGSAPVSGSDADACCCFCACSAAVLLPSLTVQAVPFVLLRTMATTYRRSDDGFVPDGLRRPPRPIAIT